MLIRSVSETCTPESTERDRNLLLASAMALKQKMQKQCRQGKQTMLVLLILIMMALVYPELNFRF